MSSDMRPMWILRQILKYLIFLVILIFFWKYANIFRWRQRRVVIKQESEKFNAWLPKYPDGAFRVPCATLLTNMTPPFSILVVDENFLKRVVKKLKCSRSDFPPLIAIPSEYKLHPTYISNPRILPYHNSSKRNYYEIIDEKKTSRGILKNIWKTYANVTLPANMERFEKMWKRSRLLDCQNRKEDFLRKLKEYELGEEPVKPKWNYTTALETMTELVDYFLNSGVYLSLNMDTLLGWFRECDLFSYSKRFEMVLEDKEYKRDAIISLEKSSKFKITRVKGAYRAGQHFFIANKKHRKTPPVLLSVIYYDPHKNQSYYMPLLTKNDRRWVFFGIVYNPFCAADVLGYLFWVSCTPETILKSAYGANWTLGVNGTIPYGNVDE